MAEPPRSAMDDLRQASAEVSGVEVLSPAAQAVLDAYASKIADSPLNWLPRYAVAAALRAAADQVQHHWDGMECVDHLQAIAAELEGATPTGSTL